MLRRTGRHVSPGLALGVSTILLMHNPMPGTKLSSNRIIVITVFLSAFVRALFAQDMLNQDFERITSENVKIMKGLSQNSVYCILQDSRGFMWFGTWDGLNKYDGYEFTIYNLRIGLSGQTVNDIHEDCDGILWIGTDGGLNKFDRENNRLTSYRHDPDKLNGLASNNVTSIEEDRLGNLWIGTHAGINMLDKETMRFHSFLHSPFDRSFIRSNHVNDLCIDTTGKIWIATRVGLICFDPTERSITRLYHIPGDEKSLPGNQVSTVYKDKRGGIWIGTANGLSKILPGNQKFISYTYNPDNRNTISNNHVTEIFEDSYGDLWVGTNGGLNRMDRENGIFIRYLNEPNNLHSLSHNRVLSIYEDNNKTLWVGTFIGVNKLDRKKPEFLHYHHIPNDTNCLNSNYVISIYEDDTGVVWIATDRGVNLLDRNTGEFSYIKHDPDNPNSLVSDNLRVIARDRKGRMWIGTVNSGMDVYDPQNETFLHLKSDARSPATLSSNSILSIFEDQNGTIWVGTNGGGLNRFNESDTTFTRFNHNQGVMHTPVNKSVWTITGDSDSTIWIGTDNGLTRFNTITGEFNAIDYLYSTHDSLISVTVFSVYRENDSVLWLGTKGSGLKRVNINTGEYITYTEKDGLSNNVVYAIVPEEENLWLSTNWGISKFNRGKGSFINYDVLDGIQSNEFNHGAYFRNRAGEIYFGGMNGFNLFDPDQITVDTTPPRTVITSFKIFSRNIERELDDQDTLVLSSSENFFSLGFSALDFTNPQKNRYMYRLDDYDQDWVYTDASRRIAEYTDVNPGTYVFHVKGTNDDGVWDQKGVSLVIIITPYWYNTWWFRGTILSLFVIGVWYMFYRRVQNIRIKHEVEKKVLSIEKQLYDTELKALRLQMNPHFIFNSLNSIQSFILNNDTDKAVNYLGKFSHLMRLILSNSRESYITIKDELKALQYYMDIEKLRFDDKFDYRIEIDPSIDEDFMEIPPMLIQPYVENAIIHGLIHKEDQGLIRLFVGLEDNHILWIIEDNGVGREKAMKIKMESGLHRKSRGMLITMERLEALNRKSQEYFSVEVIDLKDQTGNPAGTRVELRIAYTEA